ncbi:hypothetical protein [Nocardioides ultimimeridianus]
MRGPRVWVVALALSGSLVGPARAADVTGTLVATTDLPHDDLVNIGSTDTLVGGLQQTDASSPPVAGATVTLRSCPVDRSCSQRTTTADADGAWAFPVAPHRNTSVAVWYAGPPAGPAATFLVHVAPQVSMRVSARSVPRGGRVRIHGSVAPNDAGAWAVLKYYVDGQWATVTGTRVTDDSTYAFRRRLRFPAGTNVWPRVVIRRNALFATNDSRTVAITITR